MAERGWKQLLANQSWFHGKGKYPISAYSEYMPPPRLGCKPYGSVDPVLFAMSYDYVGDLSETVALMWPRPETSRGGIGDNAPPAPGLGEIVDESQPQHLAFALSELTGSLADRDPLVRLRARLEAMIPKRIGELASWLRALRASTRLKLRDTDERRRFFEAIVDGPAARRFTEGDSQGASRIAQLEESQHTWIRRHALGDASAIAHLREIDDEVAVLTDQL